MVEIVIWGDFNSHFPPSLHCRLGSLKQSLVCKTFIRVQHLWKEGKGTGLGRKENWITVSTNTASSNWGWEDSGANIVHQTCLEWDWNGRASIAQLSGPLDASCPQREWHLLGGCLSLTQKRKELTLELLTAFSGHHIFLWIGLGAAHFSVNHSKKEVKGARLGWGLGVGEWCYVDLTKAWPTTWGTLDYVWPTRDFSPLSGKWQILYSSQWVIGCITLGKTCPWVRSLSAAEKTWRSWQLEVVLWEQSSQLQEQAFSSIGILVDVSVSTVHYLHHQTHFFTYILKQLCRDPRVLLPSCGKFRRKRLEGPMTAGLGAPPGTHCSLDFPHHQLVPLLVSVAYLIKWSRGLSPLSPFLLRPGLCTIPSPSHLEGKTSWQALSR